MLTYRVPRVVDVPREFAGLSGTGGVGGGAGDGHRPLPPPKPATRPRTRAKLLHDGRGSSPLFAVDDRYVEVRATRATTSDPHKDSCVELFVQPARPATAYFAFEVNCGGAFSLRYIEDPMRTANRFAKWARVDWAQARRIEVARSMPRRSSPSCQAPSPGGWKWRGRSR